ncbi:hypothetical protein [Hymenobacter arizonensis]|uniref:Uncharacterized protein n=1 Tax=Hymenobacter arizonensis TaxID=1227077 RepID=A0A1I6B4P3_HYMAR|nr:hypothetical protein [Hymenobacter arizonensis]SFQ75876.1 hypothetical protein SAMN04515668_4159 [Hymenobacter arizonensis]
MLSTHRPCRSRNRKALLLVSGLLAGCRAQRAAFEFRPNNISKLSSYETYSQLNPADIWQGPTLVSKAEAKLSGSGLAPKRLAIMGARQSTRIILSPHKTRTSAIVRYRGHIKSGVANLSLPLISASLPAPQLKNLHDAPPDSATSLGEAVSMIGGLLIWTALILGIITLLGGASLGTSALWLLLAGVLLGGIAYGGIK